MRPALFVFLGLLLAQQPTPPATLPGRIAGTVRDAETGAPLKDAQVMIDGPHESKPITTTDTEGRFVLEGVPAGSYSVVATLADFAYPDPNPGTSWARGPQVTLGNGQRVENVTIRLAPTVSISGKVFDQEGKPATSLSITPGQKAYDANGNVTVRPGPARYGRSDETGAYRISGLLPGEYYVTAAGGGGMTTYYPGVGSLREAVPLVVSSTDLGGIDFRVVPTAAEKYAVRFRVKGIFPAPKELNLLLRSSAGIGATGFPTTVPIPDDGWIAIPALPPADYDLMIQWTDPAAESNAPPVLVGRHNVSFTVVNRDLDLGTITVQPAMTVTGRVRFKSGERFPLNVMLQSTAFDGRPRTSEWWLNEDNVFSISLVTEGRYTVGTSSLPEGQYLAAATYNSVDVLGRRFPISGSTDGRLDLVLDGPAGKLSGVVVDAKSEPVSSATVVLLPPLDRRETLDSSLVARTDQSGKFTIDRVAPGEYTALPLAVMPQYAYKNAEWLKNYEGRGVHVTVRKGEALESVLKVIPGNP